nr:immunoglobulin light chain junction region [Macaca mulatta]
DYYCATWHSIACWVF